MMIIMIFQDRGTTNSLRFNLVICVKYDNQSEPRLQASFGGGGEGQQLNRYMYIRLDK